MVGRGFFLFEFISKEDRDLIFRNGPYFMGPQGLYLNRWTPDFDPTVDVPSGCTQGCAGIGLPPQSFDPLLDSVPANHWGQAGKYIDRANPKENYLCARICVEVDLEAGLPEAIKLMVGEWQDY